MSIFKGLISIIFYILGSVLLTLAITPIFIIGLIGILGGSLITIGLAINGEV